MLEYKYLGTEKIELTGFGMVYPKDVIKVKEGINHPLFELVEKKKKHIKKRYT